jgi:hypothetical protein
MFPFASRYKGHSEKGHRLLDIVDDLILIERTVEEVTIAVSTL